MRLNNLKIMLLMGAIFLAGIAVAQDSDDDDGLIVDEAAVSSVEMQTRALADSAPVIEIRGEVYDGCTSIGDIIQRVEDDTIIIEVLTERPATAFCAQVVETFEERVAIDLTELEVGDYTIEVNGVGIDLVVSEAMLEQAAAMRENEREPGICAEPTEITQLIEDEVAEVCLLVPAEYEVTRFDDVPRQIIVDGVADDAGQGVSLSITLYTNSTRNIDDITEGLEASTDEVDFDWQELEIAGYDAYVSDEEPGQVGHRIAFVQRENLVIEISLQPIDTLFPDATEEAEAVWELLLDSFTFTADASDAESSTETD